MSEQNHSNTSTDQPAVPIKDPSENDAAKNDSESEDEDWSDDSVPFVDERANALPADKPGRSTEPGKTKRRQSFPSYPFRQHRREDRLGADNYQGRRPAPVLVTEGTKARISGSDRPQTRSTPSSSGSYYPSYYLNSSLLPYIYPNPAPTLMSLPSPSPGMPGIYPPALQQYYVPPDQAYHAVRSTSYPPPYPKYPNPNADLPGKLFPVSRRGHSSHRRDSSETKRREGSWGRHGTRSNTSHRDPGKSGDSTFHTEQDSGRAMGQRSRYGDEIEFVAQPHERDESHHTPHRDNVVIIRGSYDIDRPQHLHRSRSRQDMASDVVLQQVLERVERLELAVAAHQTLTGNQSTDREIARKKHNSNRQPRVPAQGHLETFGNRRMVPPDRADGHEKAAYHDPGYPPVPLHNAELDSIEIQPMNSAKQRAWGKDRRKENLNETRSPSPPTASILTHQKMGRNSPRPHPPSLSSSRKTAYFEISDEDNSRHHTFKPPPPRARKERSRSADKPPKHLYDSAGRTAPRKMPRKESTTKPYPRSSDGGHSKKPRVEQRDYPPAGVPPAVPDAPPS